MHNKERLTVTCGMANHCIYIHDMYNPKSGTHEATVPAINAVRDYMVDDIKEGENSVGYKWTRNDGSVVKLICIVEENQHGN